MLAASSGWRQGAVASALAFFGVVLGAVAGILIAPHVLSYVESDRMRVLIGRAAHRRVGDHGEIAGMALGRAARGGLRHPATRTVDSFVGAGLQAMAVLVAAWLLAVPLTTSGQPEDRRGGARVQVLAGVDALAPQWMRQLPSEFSAPLDTSGLPDVIGPFGRTPIATVGPPDPSVLSSPVAAALTSRACCASAGSHRVVSGPSRARVSSWRRIG